MRQTRQTNHNRNTQPSAPVSGAVPASVMRPRLLVALTTTLLVIIGLVMVFSASSIEAIDAGVDPRGDVTKQLAYALVGGALCFAIARFVPYRLWLGGLSWAVFLASLALLLLTAAIGTVGLGAQRWLTLGPINLQPSEFAKIGVLLIMAKLLYDYQEGRMGFKPFMACFIALTLVIVGLIFVAQSDLGTTLICFLGIAAILWMAEVPAVYVAGYGAVVAGLGCIGLTAGYRWERLMSFTHPWDDYYGSGYQLIHSFYAFAQGGISGAGIGNSAEKYLYLPEAQTDFIFSIIGEELGLLGAVLVIALFLGFLLGGLRMAQEAPDRFGSMLCGSFTIIIVFQAFLNIGCVMGLLPITGKPLPFVSSGGSSLIASLLMVGIMLSVSHASDESPVYRRRRQDLRVIRSDTRASGGSRGRDAGHYPRGRYASGRPYGAPRSAAPARSLQVRMLPAYETGGRDVHGGRSRGRERPRDARGGRGAPGYSLSPRYPGNPGRGRRY